MPNGPIEVWTIKRNGEIVRGAHVSEAETRRKNTFPAINLGQLSDGYRSWLSFIDVTLRPVTDDIWDRTGSVWIQSAALEPTNVPEYYRQMHPHERYVIVESDVDDTGLDTGFALVVCLLPIEFAHRDDEVGPAEVIGRGRLLADDPSIEDDGGKQGAFIVPRNAPVTFRLHDGGDVTYEWDSAEGLRRVA